jgi:hypothetical protein
MVRYFGAKIEAPCPYMGMPYMGMPCPYMGMNKLAYIKMIDRYAHIWA